MIYRGQFSISQAFRFAWAAYKRRAGLFLAILLAMFGLWVVLELLVVAGQDFGLVWWAAWHLAFLLAFAGLEAGLVRVCLDIHGGGEPTLAHAFGHFTLAPQFLAGQLAYLLLVALGLVLLIVPGLFLASRYALFGYSLVAGQANLLGSFRRSAALSAGVLVRLAGLLGLLLLFNVLGACLLGLGLFVTLPVSALVLAAVYQQLLGLPSP